MIQAATNTQVKEELPNRPLHRRQNANFFSKIFFNYTIFATVQEQILVTTNTSFY